MTRLEARQKFVDIALGEVGQREHGHNGGDAVRKYQAATSSFPGDWPWCAAFCCWVMREWLSDAAVREALSSDYGQIIKTEEIVDAWRCKTARAFGWEKWAEKAGVTLLNETARAQIGDVVMFDFSHVGIVVSDGPAGLQTVEGNTDGSGGRDGDGVYQRLRPHRVVRSYVRILP